MSVQKAVGPIGIPSEIDGMASGISQTILRQKVVVGPIIPTRAGFADIRGAEPLGQRTLFDRPAHALDNFCYLNIMHLHFDVVTKKGVSENNPEFKFTRCSNLAVNYPMRMGSSQ